VITKDHVLLVDDRPETRESMAGLLSHSGYLVQQADGREQAMEFLCRASTGAILSDVAMKTPQDGLELLRQVKGQWPALPVILYSGFARVQDAVLATKLGANDYLELPIDPSAIISAVENALTLHAKSIPLERPSPFDSSEFVARSPPMRAVVRWVERTGPTDSNVLLRGETGTGKECIAQALHKGSNRKRAPFVAVNCGAIPEALFLTELFGYRKGSFTSATSDKQGLLEEAHQGTLFLDEIGDMSLSVQAAFLRFLENGELRRVGDTKTRRIDVRVIAASHRNLREDVVHGRFRQDLYFRLSVATCVIPPLRDRLEDVVALVDVLLPSLVRRTRSVACRLNAAALDCLQSYSWPGNVRELRNVLERALALADTEQVDDSIINLALNDSPFSAAQAARPETATTERTALLTALERHHWRLGLTAASLGINRTTLWRHLRKHGITGFL
jgi:DNA-binding NtrC family response regulator